MKRFRTLLIGLFALLPLGASLPAQDFISADLSATVSQNVFEVVYPKSNEDPFTYAERLPIEDIPFSERNDPYVSIGTAFALDNGLFLSAAHVFEIETRTLRGDFSLRDQEGKVYPVGKVQSYSYWRDYIVFEVPGLKVAGLKTLTTPRINTKVFAIGNALGEGVIIRDGILTSLTPEDWKGAWRWLRFSAPASPGNSGGPLIDAQGNVLGIVLRKSENENLNYALPIAEVSSEKKALFDVRGSYVIPNITKPATYEIHESFNLPASVQDLRQQVSQKASAIYADAAKRVASQSPDELFPHSSKSESVFGDSHFINFPSVLTQQADGTWTMSAAKDPKSYRIGKDGTLTIGEQFNYTVMDLGKPSDTTVQKLLTEPKTLFDYILEGYSLSRPVASRQIRITSFGNPSEQRKFTDAWGRKWMIAVWNVPLYDFSSMLIYTPTPDGLIAFYKQAAYGYISLYENDLKVMTDFTGISYSGKLTDWTTFLDLKDYIPDIFSTMSVSYETGKYFSLDTPRVSWYVDNRNVAISDQAAFYVQPGFFKEAGGFSWDVGTFGLAEAPGYKNSAFIVKMGKPLSTASENDKSWWQGMLSGTSPFDNQAYRYNTSTYFRSTKAEADVAKVAPNYAWWFSLVYDGSPDLNQVNSKGRAMIRALTIKDRELALDRGENPGAPLASKLSRVKGRTIFDIVRDGDREGLKDFTAKKIDLDAINDGGLTPVMVALKAGQYSMALDIADAQANLSLTDPQKATALHYALRYADEATATALLKYSPNVSAEDANGYTPLMLGMDSHFGNLSSELLKRSTNSNSVTKDGLSALSEALRNGKDDIALQLIRGGASADTSDKDGWTPLLLAIRYRDAASFNELIGKKVVLNDVTKSGWNAVQICAEFYPELIDRILTKAKALVNQQTANGTSPLMLAAQFGDKVTIASLLSAGADASLVNKNGWSALMIALRYGSSASARMLMTNLKTLQGKNAEGWNVLHFAARYKPGMLGEIGDAMTNAKLIIPVNEVTNSAYTPLHLAVISSDIAALNWLLNHNADIKIRNDEGKNALDIALDRGNDEAIARLKIAAGQ